MLFVKREKTSLLSTISSGTLNLMKFLIRNHNHNANQYLFIYFRGQVCEHCSYRNANDYNWQNGTIILSADYASNGIYNFIIPLRAHFHTKTSLNPIIILLERRPDIAFLDAISYFPLVYWMLGSIDW